MEPTILERFRRPVALAAERKAAWTLVLGLEPGKTQPSAEQVADAFARAAEQVLDVVLPAHVAPLGVPDPQGRVYHAACDGRGRGALMEIGARSGNPRDGFWHDVSLWLVGLDGFHVVIGPGVTLDDGGFEWWYGAADGVRVNVESDRPADEQARLREAIANCLRPLGYAVRGSGV